MIYFNYKGSQGVETVDELNREDFKNRKEYTEAKKDLLYNYRLAGMNVYLSQRATKEWRER